MLRHSRTGQKPGIQPSFQFEPRSTFERSPYGFRRQTQRRTATPLTTTIRQTGTGRRTATAPRGPAQAAPRTPRAQTAASAEVTIAVDSKAKPANSNDTIKKVRIL